MTESKTKQYMHQSVGKMIVEFQGLERAIEHLIFSTMTSTHRQVRILMSVMSFKSKIDVMSSLIKDLHSESDTLSDSTNIFDVLEKIVKNCRKSEVRRNQLIHSFWVPGFNSDPDLVMRIKESVKSKSVYKLNCESIEHGGLDSDIKLIEETRKEVSDFCQSLCLQYSRYHGFQGLESLVDNKLVIDAINEAFLKKNTDPK